ncbi:kinase-like domain-containing protein [Lasiosphaeria ovina]|uniref:Kinase-like domain-containing protein n=1 Tax=Lasiosphaeria ovina TaxID=92902 RepID=A0AAE0TYH4_9PEZI|nr:kinase-like domain-containing protein [Lasiosphaeria ovina]
MEYFPLGDLRAYLSTPLPDEESKVVIYQPLEGLRFVHENHFAHQDLKPGNVLLVHAGPNWWVKIGDFGISKRIEFSSAQTRVGTEVYLAPEVKGLYTVDSEEEEEKTFSLAVDIWSIGAITYRLIHGRDAFAEQRSLFGYVIKSSPFPFHTALAPELADFIERTMAASPLVLTGFLKRMI